MRLNDTILSDCAALVKVVVASAACGEPGEILPSFSLRQDVPIGEGLRSGNADLRRDQHAIDLRQVLKGSTCSPRPSPKTVPPIRNSGRSEPTSSHMRSRSSASSGFSASRSSANSVLTAFEDAAPSPPCSGRLFSIVTIDFAALADGFDEAIGHAIAGVDSSVGTRGFLQRTSIPVPRPNLDLHYIVQRNRLIDRAQLVKSVVAKRTNQSVRG